MNSAAELKIVALDDLGGLGAREGAGALYAWSPPSPIPSLVPWLGILLLLALRANRSASAWLIGLPLLLVLVAGGAVGSALTFLPSEVLGVFVNVVEALAFGLAALWLVGQSFGRWHRLVGFLGILGILAGAGLVCTVARQLAENAWEASLPAGMLLAYCVLTLSVALSLAGFRCRHRYRPAALFLWSLLGLLAVPFVLGAPILLLTSMAAGDSAPWGAFLLSLAILAGICLTVLTPFLVLSFVHPFFRTRLQELLRLEGDTPPSVLSPPHLSVSPTITSLDPSPALASASPPPPEPDDATVGSSPSP